MRFEDEVAAVVPCLNEAASISTLVRHARRMIPSVIVVDDGSVDGTGQIAASAGAEVLRHHKPRGKGAALRAGWARAWEDGFSWTLIMDGDGQHSPADIPKFLDAAGQAPLIIGNRMGAARQMPWLRRRVNRYMSRRLSRMLGRELPDTQCGFRLVDLRALRRVRLAADYFEIESDMLAAFVRAGFAVEFVPVQVIYKNERSKIRPLVDTLRWFRWLAGAKRADASIKAGRFSPAGLANENVNG